MDIAQLSVSMAAQQTAQSVGIAAAKMAMDASSEALDLIEQSTASLDPGLGGSIDVSV
ncbi:YjfB family protein [Selenomonas sp. oral taxon 136]|uniref:YjfB family protein n=1 Tax=Selenomonas sp. oral taxon 136 TaxID=713030 RepID=UPI000767E4A8|nr:YjfB family protein [Selenomonas sp. oral taxon 136]AME03380.1 motility protein [Selenomonas sp. oral taxon 136]